MIHFSGINLLTDLGSGLVPGLILGLSAGLAPGPLLTLVISETLARDVGAGIRVAMAPVISDLPIVLASLFILSKLSDFKAMLGGISLLGGALVFKMGMKNWSTAGTVADIREGESSSLAKGIVVNMLSPHPYLFWISVGGPAVARAREASFGAAAAFVISFYLLLVGSKVGLAVLTGRSKSFLKGRVYIYTIKVLGVMLCVLALVLVWEGIGLIRSLQLSPVVG